MAGTVPIPPLDLAPCPPEGCQGLAPPPRALGTLVLSLGIVAALMGAQLVGYYFTRSLVIAFDALHMFVDMGAIGVALFAAWIARRPATSARTFGYYRAEILGTLANGAALATMTLLLAKEAWERLVHPQESPELAPRLMILFGAISLVANIANALLLHHGGNHAHDHADGGGHGARDHRVARSDGDHAHGDHAHGDHAHGDHAHGDHAHGDHAHAADRAPEPVAAEPADAHRDLNLQGAFLHVLGDVLGSFGAIVAGAVILATGWTPADAAIAAAMSLLILPRDVVLVVRAVDVLLESTPKHVNVATFEAALRRVAGILEVHDLHIWTLTSGVYAMSCHATIARGSEHRAVLAQLKAVIRDRFRIDHTTIQLEEAEGAAAAAPPAPPSAGG